MNDKVEYVIVPCRLGEKVDAAVAVPNGLSCEDGRKFDIKEWHPHVVAGECVTATVKVIVKMPKQ